MALFLTKVSEEDVLRHLQGKPPEPASAQLSSTSFSTTPASVLAHVPWYLFYINRDSLENHISTEPNDPPVHINLGIPRLAHDTTIQYTDATPVHPISSVQHEYMIIDDQDDQEDIVCKICNNGEEPPGNQIFMCDMCNAGVHQNCQKPRIQDSEEDINPWVCKECDAADRLAWAAGAAGVKRKWDDAEGMGGRER